MDIVIPTIADSVTTGVIARWTKKDGEYADRDETVIELETDKVMMEIPAPAAGAITQVAKVGQTVKVGEVVGKVDESAVKPEKAAAPAKAEVQAESKAPAKSAAAESKAAGGGAAARGGSSGATAVGAPAGDDDIRATPLAKKLAQEHGVDLARVIGTGAGHRVREQDVLAFVEAKRSSATTNGHAKQATASAAGSLAGMTGDRATSRERMSPLRQRIAQRLVEAQHTAAMLTTFNECDMTAVMDLRKSYKEEFEKKHSIGLGFMGFFVRACVAGLKAFPLVNASIVTDESGAPAVETRNYCDIAVAVSTPKGLVVPVIRNCERKSLAEIELAIKDLATRAKDGKLGIDEMQGGTFTITNGGIFGSLMSTPILNPPQSGILGMHAIKNRAVEHPAGSGQVAIRPMMYLALSYDHRIIDGAQAVQFLVRVKQAIEDPQRLLLEI
ncbi:MAG: 2-oxoglutarate dehydrogenase complex dihydrolipoyllysine-residue succinyltransferase [Phycisphaerales bacterium]|nr:MAG: 2-oxoglutarate dehydrogenase complex dihydrolipoyllysine-residue succinyltransferase [Phycisphaerales bacterium]